MSRNTKPEIQDSPSAWAAEATRREFAADQQKQIAELCARLAGLERRFNGQQKRIAQQEQFITKLRSEGSELRKRLRFVENAAKLTTGPAR